MKEMILKEFPENKGGRDNTLGGRVGGSKT